MGVTGIGHVVGL